MQMDFEPEVVDWVKDLAIQKEKLAHFLLDLAYVEGTWDEPSTDEELRDNYRADAWEILTRSPQLIGLTAEENLKALGLMVYPKEEA